MTLVEEFSNRVESLVTENVKTVTEDSIRRFDTLSSILASIAQEIRYKSALLTEDKEKIYNNLTVKLNELQVLLKENKEKLKSISHEKVNTTAENTNKPTDTKAKVQKDTKKVEKITKVEKPSEKLLDEEESAKLLDKLSNALLYSGTLVKRGFSKLQKSVKLIPDKIKNSGQSIKKWLKVILVGGLLFLFKDIIWGIVKKAFNSLVESDTFKSIKSFVKEKMPSTYALLVHLADLVDKVYDKLTAFVTAATDWVKDKWPFIQMTLNDLWDNLVRAVWWKKTSNNIWSWAGVKTASGEGKRYYDSTNSVLNQEDINNIYRKYGVQKGNDIIYNENFARVRGKNTKHRQKQFIDTETGVILWQGTDSFLRITEGKDPTSSSYRDHREAIETASEELSPKGLPGPFQDRINSHNGSPIFPVLNPSSEKESKINSNNYFNYSISETHLHVNEGTTTH